MKWLTVNIVEYRISLQYLKRAGAQGESANICLERNQDKFRLMFRQPLRLKVLSRPMCFLDSQISRVHKICEEISDPCKSLKTIKMLFSWDIMFPRTASWCQISTYLLPHLEEISKFLHWTYLNGYHRAYLRGRGPRWCPFVKIAVLVCPRGFQAAACFS